MAKGTPAKTNLKDQPIPESPRTDVGPPVTTGLPKNTAEPKFQAPSASPAPARSRKFGLDSAADDKQPTSNGSASNGDSHGGPTTATKHLNGNDHGKGKDKAPNKEVEKVLAKSSPKASPKHLAISSGKAIAKPAKSPTASKIPRTPTEMTATKLPTKTPDKAVRQTEKAADPKASTMSLKATGPSSIKRPPPLQASTLQSGVGFVKPKPKSPTRPIKLPTSLTTHTAASGSKSRQSLSRASGGINTAESLGRAPSRGSVSTTATSSARLGVVKSLKRQNSTINRPRPSLGPPPKQPARDHPPTKKEREVDEGFLARMTRPTQAFASKAVGKAVVSPPRKVAAAPAARKPLNKSDSKIGSLPSKPRVAPASSSAGPSSAGSSRLPQISPADKIAIRVEQVDTAEEIVEVTKSVEDNFAAHEEAAPEETEQKTTAQQIAPVVENVETAEEAVEIAKEVEGDVSLTESSQIQDEVEDHKEDTVEPTSESEALDIEAADDTAADGSEPPDESKLADSADLPENGSGVEAPYGRGN